LHCSYEGSLAECFAISAKTFRSPLEILNNNSRSDQVNKEQVDLELSNVDDSCQNRFAYYSSNPINSKINVYVTKNFKSICLNKSKLNRRKMIKSIYCFEILTLCYGLTNWRTNELKAPAQKSNPIVLT